MAKCPLVKCLGKSLLYEMNGPKRTAVSRKELWQKRKQKEFLKLQDFLAGLPVSS